MTPTEMKQYEELLPEKNPVDAELTRISRNVSFDFVAPLLSDRYCKEGRPAYNPVFMFKIVFLAIHALNEASDDERAWPGR